MRTKSIYLKALCFAFLVLNLSLVASCKEQDHKEVRKSFMKYVEEDFGDPSTMKEITAVEVKDTVNLGTILRMANNVIKTADRIKKDDSISLNWLMPIFRHEKWNEYVFDNTIDVVKMYGKFKDSEDDFFKKYNILKKVIERKEEDNVSYIHYLLKARIQEKGELTVKEYHGYKYKNGNMVWFDSNLYAPKRPEYWEDVLFAVEYLKIAIEMHKGHSENLTHLMQKK